MKEGRILIADDQKGILNALQLVLQRDFETADVLPDPSRIISVLAKTEYDVILLDMNFKAGINTGNEGLYWLREIKKKHPGVEVVMITAYGDVELAVRSLKEGAADFILKPWDNEKLIATLKAATRLRRSGKEIARLKDRETLLKNETNRIQPLITGKSPAMKNIWNLVRKVANTEANVLITGENGTGKEMIAREIHFQSDRKNELFVLVDLSALTESLIESELFGHKKGSFTNAFEDKTGRFELADRGTLFLDEIGNVPYSLQTKLLSVLQTRTITPVGATKEISVNARLISATNKDLNQLISAGHFREDLLYRINTIRIHLPALRERIEDVEELVRHFLSLYNRKYNKNEMTISEPAIEKLRSYHWPGNIRELQHAVEKAVILNETGILQPNDFYFGQQETGLFDGNQTLEEMEKRMIIAALRKNNMNQTLTSEQLGITRQTLYNKMKKYGI